jgi:hypothetical protein
MEDMTGQCARNAFFSAKYLVSPPRSVIEPKDNLKHKGEEGSMKRILSLGRNSTNNSSGPGATSMQGVWTVAESDPENRTTPSGNRDQSGKVHALGHDHVLLRISSP